MNEQQIIQQITQLVDAAQNGDKQALKILQDTKTKAEQGDEQSIAIMQVVEQIMNQKQKAKHGTKLQYIKSLKNQCAEDEELYYYKKGGSVGCGCKKKEDGGEIVSAKCGSPVEKFKKARKMQNGGVEQKKEGWDNKGNYIVRKAKIEERKKQLEANKNEEGQADPNKKKPQPKPQPKQPVKKGCNGIVANFKKVFRNGGSLNEALFIKKNK